MKIALITDVIYPYTVGGSEFRNWEVGRRLVARGHEVHIFGGKFWDGPDVIERDGMVLHGVSPYERLYTDSGKRAIREPLSLALRHPRTLAGDRFDVIDVLAFVFFSCYSVRLYALYTRTPIVLTWQQYFSSYLRGYFGTLKGVIGQILERGTTLLFRHHVAVSPHVSRSLARRGVPGHWIHMVPNGVDVEGAAAATPANAAIDMLFVGRVNYQKNLELFIDSVKRVATSHPHVHAVIVGNGADRVALIAYVQELGVAQNVSFWDAITDRRELFSYMKAANVFILPSRLEGLPLTMLEAQACGVPVVTTTTPYYSARDYIEDGVNGWNVSADADEIARATVRILDDPKVRQRMSKAAVERAQSYSWDAVTDQMETLYRSMSR